MAKGSTAKASVEAQIQKAFGANFLGVADKKLYVLADDGGEMVQIAITLTCPKTPVDFGNIPQPTSTSKSGFNDWSTPAKAPEVKVTAQEQENIQKMLERLGL